MATPSFEQLLAEARRQSEQKADVQRADYSSQIANGFSNVVTNSLFKRSPNNQSLTGYVTKEGDMTNFSTPQNTNQNLWERLSGNQPMQVPQGALPLTAENQASVFLKMLPTTIVDPTTGKVITQTIGKPAILPKPDKENPMVDVLGPKGEKVGQAPKGSIKLGFAPEGKVSAKLKAGQLNAKLRLDEALANLDEMIKETTDISSHPSLGWATGMTSFSSKVPGTGSRNVSARINTLKAKTAFATLASMREASKTGGALGQISDKEEDLLRDAVSALDQGQSTEAFKGSLDRLKIHAEKSKKRLIDAYNETYGDIGSGNTTETNPLGL